MMVVPHNQEILAEFPNNLEFFSFVVVTTELMDVTRLSVLYADQNMFCY